VFVVVGVVVLAGCSDDAPSQEEVTDAVVESGIDQRAAECAVAAFYDDVSTESLEQIVDGSEDLDDAEDQQAYTEAFQQCLAVGFEVPEQGGA